MVAYFVPNGEGCERDKALEPPFSLGSNHVAKNGVVSVEPGAAGGTSFRISIIAPLSSSIHPLSPFLALASYSRERGK